MLFRSSNERVGLISDISTADWGWCSLIEYTVSGNVMEIRSLPETSELRKVRLVVVEVFPKFKWKPVFVTNV